MALFVIDPNYIYLIFSYAYMTLSYTWLKCMSHDTYTFYFPNIIFKKKEYIIPCFKKGLLHFHNSIVRKLRYREILILNKIILQFNVFACCKWGFGIFLLFLIRWHSCYYCQIKIINVDKVLIKLTLNYT